MRTLVLISSTLLLAASVGCSRKIEDPAPMQTGSKLVYDVIEEFGKSNLTYQITMTFTKDGDELVAKMSTSEPKTKVGKNGVSRLDLGGLSKSGDDMVLITATGAVLNFGGLYLPAKDRRNGVITKIGRVTQRRAYEKWDTWAVMFDRGGGQGTMFFDNQLGVLVGWNIQTGGSGNVGKLASAQ